MADNKEYSRADPGEIEQRLKIIQDLIVRGLSQAKIVAFCRERHAAWEVTDRQIRKYYAAAWELFASEASQVDRKAYFKRHLSRLDHIVEESLKLKDYRTALSAEQQTAKVLRLDTPGADVNWEQAAAEALGVKSPNDLYNLLFNKATTIVGGLETEGDEHDAE